ncbi:MAG: F-box protein, partial [Cytophagaceae bacterium]
AGLSNEIYSEIFSHLPQRHLRLVSQTCRTLAALAKPLLFETLVLHGDPQEDRYYHENGRANVIYPGRSKTVELSALGIAVDELIALDIARHVRCLQFGPKVYVAGT